ncbi:zinc ribbon domain-containing protein [Planctomycetota bacterium]
MGPLLDGLIKLQSVESRLRAVNTKLVRCRRSVIVQENQIRNLQNTAEAKKEEMTLTKVQSDRLELELKSRDESIAKLRAALNNSKTNKEYAAVLTQLNTTKADNSKIETQVLDLMKDIEADEAELVQMQEQIEQQKQTLDQKRKDSEVQAQKHEAEIEDIRIEWDKAAESISPEALEVFKRVAETYDGESLAVVEKQEGKIEAYSCGGCFMGVTAESVNLLMTKDDMIRCPNCTRILVLSASSE